MEQFYAAYSGNIPATLDINGHRVAILTHTREELEDHLDLVGADRVLEIESAPFSNEEDAILDFAVTSHASVVISPPELDLPEVLEGLKQSLPWPQ